MKRVAVPSILVVVVWFALGVTAEAQQPKKVSRIGYLSSFESAFESTRSEAIRLALRERGYIEGVQQATKFEFIINLKAAKQIGLTIPVRVLERAN